MQPKEIIAAWVDSFNKGDIDALANFYHEDAVNHQVTNAPIVGKQAIHEMFRREFASADMVCIPEHILQDGEWAILEWRDPKGLRGCGFFHITEGKIKYQRGYWDKLSFLKLYNLPLSLNDCSWNK